VPLEPDQISTAGLDKRLGRYAAEPVERLIEDVRLSYEELWLERAQARKTVEDLRDQLDRYRNLEHQLSEVLALAEQAAAERREKAEHEIEAMLNRAREEARDVVFNATAERDRMRAETSALEQRARELETQYKAFLLAALELVASDPEARDVSSETSAFAADDEGRSSSAALWTAPPPESRNR
jgi:cell division septum initiation protein DivIVA